MYLQRFYNPEEYIPLTPKRDSYLDLKLPYSFTRLRQSELPFSVSPPPIIEGVFPFRPEIPNDLLEIFIRSPHEVVLTASSLEDYEELFIASLGFDPTEVSITDFSALFIRDSQNFLTIQGDRAFLTKDQLKHIPVIMHAINLNLIYLPNSIKGLVIEVELNMLCNNYLDSKDELQDSYDFYEEVYCPISNILSALVDHQLFLAKNQAEYQKHLDLKDASPYYQMFRSLESIKEPEYLMIEDSFEGELAWICDFTDTNVFVGLYDNFYYGVSDSSVYHLGTVHMDSELNLIYDAYQSIAEAKHSRRVYDEFWNFIK